MNALKLSFLLLALTGCARPSFDETVLAAFGDSDIQLFDDTSRVNYVIFTDERTASIFGDQIGNGRLKLASKDAKLLCPEVQEGGVHGYELSAHMDSTWQDSAFARLVTTCIARPLCDSCVTGGSSSVLMSSTVYLMVRKNGKWRVDKPIAASKSFLM